MELLKKKIIEDGKVLSDNILKVDAFLNHQIDVKLMQAIGKEFAHKFRDEKVTKILTVESSGIAPALFTATELNVDVVFARKRKSITMQENLYTAEVFSYTKNELTTITISKDHIKNSDSILIIDDFLANGEVAQGLIKVVNEVGAQIAGIGIVIEKSFQKGRSILEETGIPIYSLVRIQSLKDRMVAFL